MKYLYILLMMVFLCSCELGNEGPRRVEYWKTEIEYVKSNRPEIGYLMVKYKAFEPIFNPSENTLTIVDSGEANSIVCSKWHYIITFKADSKGVVTESTIEQAGTCL
ncbi:hypothetical protein ACJJIF_09375 [Microbulbifer sp. SSSA002]|uniref:hypothetical protein n=1 Tax=unclassified Microbulbifer TaxID=2619833 RepID=UPI0040397D64